MKNFIGGDELFAESSLAKKKLSNPRMNLCATCTTLPKGQLKFFSVGCAIWWPGGRGRGLGGGRGVHYSIRSFYFPIFLFFPCRFTVKCHIQKFPFLTTSIWRSAAHHLLPLAPIGIASFNYFQMEHRTLQLAPLSSSGVFSSIFLDSNWSPSLGAVPPPSLWLCRSVGRWAKKKNLLTDFGKGKRQFSMKILRCWKI